MGKSIKTIAQALGIEEEQCGMSLKKEEARNHWCTNDQTSNWEVKEENCREWQKHPQKNTERWASKVLEPRWTSTKMMERLEVVESVQSVTQDTEAQMYFRSGLYDQTILIYFTVIDSNQSKGDCRENTMRNLCILLQTLRKTPREGITVSSYNTGNLREHFLHESRTRSSLLAPSNTSANVLVVKRKRLQATLR